MIHTPMDTAPTECIQYLLEPIFSGLRLPRSSDPAEVVVSLITRLLFVGGRQTSDEEDLTHITRHLVARPLSRAPTVSP